LETKHAYGVGLETLTPCGAISSLTPIGPLQRRPPRHQRRPFRRVGVGIRDCWLRHAIPALRPSSATCESWSWKADSRPPRAHLA